MATHSGDGTAKESVTKDRRVPLASVKFITATEIPGSTTMMTTLEAGTRRLVDGKEWVAPPLWFDPDTRCIKVGNRAYPLEQVRWFDRATAAITKSPPPLDLDKYTIRIKQ